MLPTCSPSSLASVPTWQGPSRYRRSTIRRRVGWWTARITSIDVMRRTLGPAPCAVQEFLYISRCISRSAPDEAHHDTLGPAPPAGPRHALHGVQVEPAEPGPVPAAAVRHVTARRADRDRDAAIAPGDAGAVTGQVAAV